MHELNHNFRFRLCLYHTIYPLNVIPAFQNKFRYHIDPLGEIFEKYEHIKGEFERDRFQYFQDAIGTYVRRQSSDKTKLNRRHDSYRFHNYKTMSSHVFITKF